MKRLTAILCMSSMAAFICVASMSNNTPYVQPEDNGVRDIIIQKVHDGDTVTASVCFGSLGQSEFWAHNIRLRLRGVHAYEIEAEDKQPAVDRKVALAEREALAAALFANSAKPIRARLFRQTYDRYEADIFTAKQNVNELMLTYPQGGR